ncbi:MAG: hypothetical protein IKD04_05405 [Clostridia bacterium]|nr:hypothetical protein [Clostridia bacterium]
MKRKFASALCLLLIFAFLCGCNPVSGSSVELNAEEIVTDKDVIGEMDLQLVKDIKEAYIKYRGEENRKLTDVVIDEYLGTYSDGSIFIQIRFNGESLRWDTEKIFGKNIPVGLPVYKNNEFMIFSKKAINAGAITEKIVTEFLNAHPEYEVDLSIDVPPEYISPYF